MYLLVLAFTCIRHEVRLCVVAGIAAMVQYIAIVFWALRAIDPSQATSYGAFRWDNQIVRVAILAFATAIHVAIEDLLTALTLPNGTLVSVTMSIGAASFPADGTNVPDLIAVADARMYAAKRAVPTRRAVVRPLVNAAAHGPSRA
jgi:hypothetical protein